MVKRKIILKTTTLPEQPTYVTIEGEDREVVDMVFDEMMSRDFANHVYTMDAASLKPEDKYKLIFTVSERWDETKVHETVEDYETAVDRLTFWNINSECKINVIAKSLINGSEAVLYYVLPNEVDSMRETIHEQVG